MAMEGDLICNFKKCRKRLDSEAWITSCSHIFCEEDGAREFNKAYICPACQTSLSGKYDVTLVDLQPSEQYKSMVLAGQKPDVVMEVCTRALSFWTYQAQQELSYQEFVANKAKEKTVQLEKYYEDVIKSTQAELNFAKKELETTKQRYNDASSKLTDKNRQYHKLQSMYDTLRRKFITPATFEPGNSGDMGAFQNSARRHSMFPLNNEDLMNIQRSNTLSIASSPPERDFVLRPNSTPTINHDIADTRPRFTFDIRNAQVSSLNYRN